MVSTDPNEAPTPNPDTASSSALPSLWSFLRCPRCQNELVAQTSATSGELEELECQRCSRGYPVFLGIPLVTARPQEWRESWERGLGLFADWMIRAEKELQVAFFDEDLSDRSQNRVRQVIGALGKHREEVLTLMRRAGIQAKAPNDKPQAGAAEYSPETYFNHILRDYGWHSEVDEVAASFDRLRQVLPPDFQPGNTLVLGAGTGRLAWQFATEFGASASVLALDVNPLPFIVTRLILAGEAVDLTELPAHPKGSNQVALTRRLACALPPPPRLSFLLADGLEPPVAPGKWDTVVVPWFVDEVPTDAAVVPELARSLLCEGGSFVCVGPLLYDNAHTKACFRYCADEFVDLVKRAGFQVTRGKYEAESYMASPLSSHTRVEHVLYLHARKVSSQRQVSPEIPPYLKPGAGASLSIPAPPGLADTQFSPEQVAEVAALIDGSRNIRQITKLLVDRGVLVNDGTQEAAVRGCLKIMLKQLREAAARAPKG